MKKIIPLTTELEVRKQTRKMLLREIKSKIEEQKRLILELGEDSKYAEAKKAAMELNGVLSSLMTEKYMIVSHSALGPIVDRLLDLSSFPVSDQEFLEIYQIIYQIIKKDDENFTYLKTIAALYGEANETFWEMTKGIFNPADPINLVFYALAPFTGGWSLTGLLGAGAVRKASFDVTGDVAKGMIKKGVKSRLGKGVSDKSAETAARKALKQSADGMKINPGLFQGAQDFISVTVLRGKKAIVITKDLKRQLRGLTSNKKFWDELDSVLLDDEVLDQIMNAADADDLLGVLFDATNNPKFVEFLAQKFKVDPDDVAGIFAEFLDHKPFADALFEYASLKSGRKAMEELLPTAFEAVLGKAASIYRGLVMSVGAVPRRFVAGTRRFLGGDELADDIVKDYFNRKLLKPEIDSNAVRGEVVAVGGKLLDDQAKDVGTEAQKTAARNIFKNVDEANLGEEALDVTLDSMPADKDSLDTLINQLEKAKRAGKPKKSFKTVRTGSGRKKKTTTEDITPKFTPAGEQFKNSFDNFVPFDDDATREKIIKELIENPDASDLFLGVLKRKRQNLDVLEEMADTIADQIVEETADNYTREMTVRIVYADIIGRSGRYAVMHPGADLLGFREAERSGLAANLTGGESRTEPRYDQRMKSPYEDEDGDAVIDSLKAAPEDVIIPSTPEGKELQDLLDQIANEDLKIKEKKEEVKKEAEVAVEQKFVAAEEMDSETQKNMLVNPDNEKSFDLDDAVVSAEKSQNTMLAMIDAYDNVNKYITTFGTERMDRYHKYFAFGSGNWASEMADDFDLISWTGLFSGSIYGVKATDTQMAGLRDTMTDYTLSKILTGGSLNRNKAEANMYAGRYAGLDPAQLKRLQEELDSTNDVFNQCDWETVDEAWEAVLASANINLVNELESAASDPSLKDKVKDAMKESRLIESSKLREIIRKNLKKKRLISESAGTASQKKRFLEAQSIAAKRLKSDLKSSGYDEFFGNSGLYSYLRSSSGFDPANRSADLRTGGDSPAAKHAKMFQALSSQRQQAVLIDQAAGTQRAILMDKGAYYVNGVAILKISNDDLFGSSAITYECVSFIFGNLTPDPLLGFGAAFGTGVLPQYGAYWRDDIPESEFSTDPAKQIFTTLASQPMKSPPESLNEIMGRSQMGYLTDISTPEGGYTYFPVYVGFYVSNVNLSDNPLGSAKSGKDVFNSLNIVNEQEFFNKIIIDSKLPDWQKYGDRWGINSATIKTGMPGSYVGTAMATSMFDNDGTGVIDGSILDQNHLERFFNHVTDGGQLVPTQVQIDGSQTKPTVTSGDGDQAAPDPGDTSKKDARTASEIRAKVRKWVMSQGKTANIVNASVDSSTMGNVFVLEKGMAYYVYRHELETEAKNVAPDFYSGFWTPARGSGHKINLSLGDVPADERAALLVLIIGHAFDNSIGIFKNSDIQALGRDAIMAAAGNGWTSSTDEGLGDLIGNVDKKYKAYKPIDEDRNVYAFGMFMMDLANGATRPSQKPLKEGKRVKKHVKTSRCFKNSWRRK